MNSFLSFEHKTSRLCITADHDFNPRFLRRWEKEGFDVVPLRLGTDRTKYVRDLDHIREGLSVSESYAVISFGEAAAFCLNYYLHPQHTSKLRALVAYYPTRIPDTAAFYPLSTQVIVHFAIQPVGVEYISATAHKTHIAIRQITTGIGTGGRLSLNYPAFAYTNAVPGFAEPGRPEYNQIAARLAWSRTLSVLRKGTDKQVDLEKVWDEIQEERYFASGTPDSLTRYITESSPSIIYTPTLQGAHDIDELQDFYRENFLRGKPDSLQLRLLSRTVGVDRLVDELYMSFTHSQELPWILPGLSPTHKTVEVIVVSIVSFRGGQLVSEHVYWDQASVLAQVGLLDPMLAVQGDARMQGTQMVTGKAAKILLAEDLPSSSRH